MYIINPKTGRKVLKNGKTGKKILKNQKGTGMFTKKSQDPEVAEVVKALYNTNIDKGFPYGSANRPLVGSSSNRSGYGLRSKSSCSMFTCPCPSGSSEFENAEYCKKNRGSKSNYCAFTRREFTKYRRKIKGDDQPFGISRGKDNPNIGSNVPKWGKLMHKWYDRSRKAGCSWVNTHAYHADTRDCNLDQIVQKKSGLGRTYTDPKGYSKCTSTKCLDVNSSPMYKNVYYKPDSQDEPFDVTIKGKKAKGCKNVYVYADEECVPGLNKVLSKPCKGSYLGADGNLNYGYYNENGDWEAFAKHSSKKNAETGKYISTYAHHCIDKQCSNNPYGTIVDGKWVTGVDGKLYKDGTKIGITNSIDYKGTVNSSTGGAKKNTKKNDKAKKIKGQKKKKKSPSKKKKKSPSKKKKKSPSKKKKSPKSKQTGCPNGTRKNCSEWNCKKKKLI